MNRLRRNPMLQVAKCELCPNTVTNFVTGLCGRCSMIWAAKKQLAIRLANSPYPAMAAVVKLAQCSLDSKVMDPTFRQVIETARSQRSEKSGMLQKLRSQFLESVLVKPFHDRKTPYATDDDYWNVPEIMDRDYLKFQKQIDQLKAIPTDVGRNQKTRPPK